MAASTFDALAAARALKAAGMEAGPAEAVAGQIRTAADQLRDVVDADRDTLATKADLAVLRAEIRADLYRALWIQGGAFVAIFGGFIAIAAGLGIL